MIETKPLFEKLVRDLGPADKSFKRNLLKEQIHILALDFLYSHPVYGQLIFYGGSCLRHCFNLPRLSEDLDFVDLKNNIDLGKMAEDIESFFYNETDLRPKVLVQPSRIKLKFAILKELGLALPSDYQSLLLKIEVFKHFDYCAGYKVDVVAIFKLNRSVVLKTFDLPTMMATKMAAVLHRKWQKIAKRGEVLASVKGRDYFDLIWYFNQGIKPNLKCIMDFKDGANLKDELLKAVAKVNEQSIKFDLEPLIEDKNFVDNFSKNIKAILKREIDLRL